LRLDPEAKLIEIGDADCPVAHSVDQMLTNAAREIVPTFDPGHSSAKNHAAQLVTETFGLFRVGGVAETLGELEELLLLALLSLDAIFD
jgi:hypothetical protein